MTANGNSPLDNMRTLEHYLSDIMRAGAADTPEHLKVKGKGAIAESLSRRAVTRKGYATSRRLLRLLVHAEADGRCANRALGVDNASSVVASTEHGSRRE
ncbi:hypothetical protein X777_06308 [Ooceraea biroi]|uniref:Uncharacterized protein n=1 Tax=Ooceraea biroi TaxID=2015173 RepID=A0A026WDX4_OOCBI|nr:hypothetical protein X777_06308 [Ooceraea biroi]